MLIRHFDDRAGPLYDQLCTHPKSITPQPLTADTISELLYSLSLSAWKQAGGARRPLRVNPSSGNLHPTEGS